MGGNAGRTSNAVSASGRGDTSSGQSSIVERTGSRGRRTAGLEAVVKRLLPRAHLDDADELLLDLSFAVEERQQRAEVLADQLWLVLGGRVERPERNFAHTLRGARATAPWSAGQIRRGMQEGEKQLTRSVSCMSDRNSTMNDARMSSYDDAVSVNV